MFVLEQSVTDDSATAKTKESSNVHSEGVFAL
jgi:hypothetical protein